MQRCSFMFQPLFELCRYFHKTDRDRAAVAKASAGRQADRLLWRVNIKNMHADTASLCIGDTTNRKSRCVPDGPTQVSVPHKYIPCSHLHLDAVSPACEEQNNGTNSACHSLSKG